MKRLRSWYRWVVDWGRWVKELRYALKHGNANTSNTVYVKYAKTHTFLGKRVLNVGCGNSPYPSLNVTNTDIFPVPGVNVLHTLGKEPLPFEDNTFDLVIANHVLEHVEGWWGAFKELARVVKVGGTVEVWLPGDGGTSQQGYRDHVNVINACSWAGVRTTIRNNANAWEAEEAKNLGHIKDLEIDKSKSGAVLVCAWWVVLWPQCIRLWMVRHLRNCVNEQSWFFIKREPLKEDEYEKQGGKR